MLRIAIPNKGGLAAPAMTLLQEAGYRTTRRGRELYVTDTDNQVEIFFLRPRDIAVYIGAGYIHAGITGRDLVQDSGVEAIEVRALEFGRSTFRFAAPAGQINQIAHLAGKRIATSFDLIVRNFLLAKDISAQVVHLDGAVESAVRLGVADAIADVVETGNTLRAAGLEVFGDPILQSSAVLITSAKNRTLEQLQVLDQRLGGVLNARNYVLVDYNIDRDRMEQVAAVTPGISSPTISPLHDPQFLAVRAMVPRKTVNQTVDQLHQLGASGILVTELLSCRI